MADNDEVKLSKAEYERLKLFSPMKMPFKPELKDFGFKHEETLEIFPPSSGHEIKTGYPKPERSFRMVLESYQQSIEEFYFWIIDHIREFGLHESIKISDLFAASEQSSFFGIAQQKIGLQQDKAAQFLKIIADMTKGLFQIVREVRILDERLAYYEDSQKFGEKAHSAEITLKGIWIDLVEGGAKNPASVYGLSREVGFVILPDLFFRVRREPNENDEAFHKKIARMDKEQGGDFNPKVLEVLRRKLTQYYNWKDRTYHELKTRKNFQLKYLRQHYDTIMLYLNWVKPYLRNVRRLNLDLSKTDTADIISAFEGSMVEIEIILKRKPKQDSKYNAVVLCHWDYRTRPQLTYAQEYQRQPIHVGRADMVLRGYVWTDEDLERYIAYRRHEDFAMLMSIEESIKEAVEGLGDKLREYLVQGGEAMLDEREVKDLAAQLKKEKHADDESAAVTKAKQILTLSKTLFMNNLAKDRNEAQEKARNTVLGAPKGSSMMSILEPFAALASGTKEIATAFVSFKSAKKSAKKSELEDEKEKKDAQKMVENAMWNAYKNYKKAHGMMSW